MPTMMNNIKWIITGHKPFWYYWFNVYSVSIDLKTLTGTCDSNTAKFLRLN